MFKLFYEQINKYGYDWQWRLSHRNIIGGTLGKYDWRWRLCGSGCGDYCDVCFVGSIHTHHLQICSE